MGLTRDRKILTGRDDANTGKVNGHEGRGVEGRKEGRDDQSICEMSLDSGDAECGTIGGLGVNEGAQERKSECSWDEEHGGGIEQTLFERLESRSGRLSWDDARRVII